MTSARRIPGTLKDPGGTSLDGGGGGSVDQLFSAQGGQAPMEVGLNSERSETSAEGDFLKNPDIDAITEQLKELQFALK